MLVLVPLVALVMLVRWWVVGWGGGTFGIRTIGCQMQISLGGGWVWFGAPGAGERWWALALMSAGGALALMSAGAGGALVGGGGTFGFRTIGCQMQVVVGCGLVQRALSARPDSI